MLLAAGALACSLAAALALVVRAGDPCRAAFAPASEIHAAVYARRSKEQHAAEEFKSVGFHACEPLSGSVGPRFAARLSLQLCWRGVSPGLGAAAPSEPADRRGGGYARGETRRVEAAS